MKIEPRIKQRMFETSINFWHYRRNTPPTNLVIFLHGRGERGPADGSQIKLIERNNGWPKFAKGIRPGETVSRGTVEYDKFDIIAPQVVATDSTYKEIMYSVIPWAVAYFGYKRVIPVGISMGGYGILDLLKNDIGENVIGAVNVCGSADVSEVPHMRKVPGLSWHGDKDTTVSHNGNKAFVEAYNAAGGKFEFISLPGVAHDAWNYAFNADPEKDRTLQFVNGLFKAAEDAEAKPAPANVDLKALKNKNLDEVVAAVNALRV